jgi:hypothetical protein
MRITLDRKTMKPVNTEILNRTANTEEFLNFLAQDFKIWEEEQRPNEKAD